MAFKFCWYHLVRKLLSKVDISLYIFGTNNFLAPILIVLITACNPPKHKELVAPKISHNQIIVLNEGGYTYNNAEISVYDADSNKVENEVYFRNNHKPLGDVLQSVTWFEGHYYWVLNNSQSIVVTDSNFIEQYSIVGFKSPRYIHFVDQSKAYVSDLYDDRIAVVDLVGKRIDRYIRCKAGTEKFLQQKLTNDVWVSNSYTNHIYKIDPQRDQLVDSVTTDHGPYDMLYDRNGFVWVSCSGLKSKGESSALLCIDLTTKKLVKRLEADDKGSFGEARLCMNANKDTMYWTAQGIKRAAITADVYPSDYFVEANGRIFYGLNVNPYNGDVYACDAVDYSQNGYVIRYDQKGNELAKFKVGKIPNGLFIR